METLAALFASDLTWWVMAGQIVASVLNTIMSSDTPVGKIINAIALGIGKARPDPSAQ